MEKWKGPSTQSNNLAIYVMQYSHMCRSDDCPGLASVGISKPVVSMHDRWNDPWPLMPVCTTRLRACGRG